MGHSGPQASEGLIPPGMRPQRNKNLHMEKGYILPMQWSFLRGALVNLTVGDLGSCLT